MKSFFYRLVLTGSAFAALAGGCQHRQQTESETATVPVVEPERQPAEPQTRRTAYYPRAGESMNISELYFPTGDPGTSALLMHTVMPKTVNRNNPYDFEIHATNNTAATLQDVVVDLKNTNNMSLTAAEPDAMPGEGGGARWSLGDLGAGKTRIIRVRASSESLGSAGNCLEASYNNELCATTNVVEAGLTLVKRATRETLLCDTITLEYEVCNPGSGVATNVKIADDLPEGMTIEGGGRRVSLDIGSLAPGECKTITRTASVARTGEYVSLATATAAGNLSADSDATTTLVRQPVLEIVSECTDTQFVGRNITYTWTVTNTGDAACSDTIVSARLPANSTFVRASGSGRFQGGNGTWNLGSLAPGAERSFNVTVTPAAIGRYTARAQVDCYCAETVAADCTTEVKGISAILLEVVDLVDPVEVGQTTTYEITATNQGSAPGTNIQIECILPPEMEFVSGDGATRGRVSGRTITFAPLPRLDALTKATWRIVVRTTGEGSVRFATKMLSDQLGDNPVSETEATNLYK